MKCTFCGNNLRNIGDKRIKPDTILRKVICDSCGTVKTYEKTYPLPQIKRMKIIKTEEGYVVNPKIVTKKVKKKVFHPFEKIFPPKDVAKIGEVDTDGIR